MKNKKELYSLSHICKCHRLDVAFTQDWLKKQKCREVKQINRRGWLFTHRQAHIMTFGVKFGLGWKGAEKEFYIAKYQMEHPPKYLET